MRGAGAGRRARGGHARTGGRGDEEAFRELTEPHRRELQLHCYCILGSMQDAEDLTQETLLAAWRGLEAFEGRASVRAWLYRIATNRCLNALRARSRRPREVPAMPPRQRAALVLGDVCRFLRFSAVQRKATETALPSGKLLDRAQGACRNRTGVNGFAGRCVTTPPRRRASSVAPGVGWIGARNRTQAGGHDRVSGGAPGRAER